MTDLHQRSSLPIADIQAPGLTTYDAKDPDTAFPPIEPLLPPAGAPNVLIVLLDDVGFGASSAFGGPCHTPDAERLAAGGLKYNRFHTTALCAPTAPGPADRPQPPLGGHGLASPRRRRRRRATARCGPTPRRRWPMTLKLNGYSTAQFGKCHEVPVWQSSPMGPFDAWPSGGGGFENFYGFIGGENNQWDPALYEGTTPVEPPATPEEGYHLTEDLADRAINWVRQQKALMPDQPFFMYFAPGATHAPHHVPAGVGRQVRGASSPTAGTPQREETFARQKELGVIPADAELTDAPRRDPGLGRHARRAEAGARAPDGGLRRVPRAHRLPRRPGARRHRGPRRHGRHARSTTSSATTARRPRARSTARSTRWPTSTAWPTLETPEFMLSKIDEFGSPELRTTTTRSAGRGRWTPRSSGPSRSRRTGAAPATAPSSTGRTASTSPAACASSSPTSSTWPRRSSRPPGCPSRRSVNGVQQSPDGGHEHALHVQRGRRARTPRPAVLRDVRQPRHVPPGLERGHQAPTPWVMVGARCRRSTTTCGSSTTAPADYSQANDLSDEHPELLAKLQRLWLIEATKYNVLPIDDRTGERLDPDQAGRPTLIRGDSQRSTPAWAGCRRTASSASRTGRSRSPPRSTVPDGGADGVIIAQGGRFGGWAVYAKGGKAHVHLQRARHPGVRTWPPTSRSRPAPTRCAWSSRTTAAVWPRAATSRCTTTAPRWAPGRVEATQPMVFSADETTDIGYESGTTVSAGLHRRDQPLHRHDQLGPARRRRRRPRPLHRPRRAAPRRHGPPVASATVEDHQDEARLGEPGGAGGARLAPAAPAVQIDHLAVRGDHVEHGDAAAAPGSKRSPYRAVRRRCLCPGTCGPRTARRCTPGPRNRRRSPPSSPTRSRRRRR